MMYLATAWWDRAPHMELFCSKDKSKVQNMVDEIISENVAGEAWEIEKNWENDLITIVDKNDGTHYFYRISAVKEL